MRLLLLAVSLAAALVLPGCADDGGPNLLADPSPSPAMAVATPPPALRLPAVYAAICETSTGLSYGAAPLGGGSAEPATCAFAAARSGDLTALKGAVIEATWTAGTGVTGAQLLVQSDHCRRGTTVDTGGLHQDVCDGGHAEGASGPLRVEVGPDVLAKWGADNLTVYVLADGVTTAQPFTIYVTLFEGVPPVGFSAIP